MKSIANEIAELRGLEVPELVDRYRAAFGTEPRVRHREWLWKRIAWKIQEQRFGGLSGTAKRRLDELIADLDLPLGESQRTVSGALNGRRRPSDPPLGTTFARTWRGREIRATAVDGGWECEGVVHRSLSAVAKAVTGSHWNGRLFFGLTARSKSIKACDANRED